MPLHLIAALACSSCEIRSQIAHPYVALLLVVAFGLTFRLSAFIRDLEFDRDLMRLIVKALQTADLSHKEAHMLMGYHAGQWSEIVSCQRPAPSLSRMAFLPKAFWKAFIWDFAALVIKHKIRNLVSEDRKAS